MFRVVTVGREYGSGGGLIAQRLANRLGLETAGPGLDREDRGAFVLIR